MVKLLLVMLVSVVDVVRFRFSMVRVKLNGFIRFFILGL